MTGFPAGRRYDIMFSIVCFFYSRMAGCVYVILLVQAYAFFFFTNLKAFIGFWLNSKLENKFESLVGLHSPKFPAVSKGNISKSRDR